MYLDDIIIINNAAPTKPAATNLLLTFLPALSFGFVILSFIIDRALANRSKKKQIIREWYSKALLDPCLSSCNKFFDDVKELTVTNLIVFEKKNLVLPTAEFRRYKGNISDRFEKIKILFYNESLLPIYQNYPKIADSANNVLLRIQDQFIVVFGGSNIDPDVYDSFINSLYIEKGKLLAILEAPLSSKGKTKLDLN